MGIHVICADSQEEAVHAIQLMKVLAGQKTSFDIEYHKAEVLSDAGFLTEDDVVWTVASGPLGAETVAYREFVGTSIGIDPKFPGSETANNCIYIDKTVEEVIRDYSVPRPTYVASNNYSGMGDALPDILDMKTDPTCVLSPCGCESCKELYYKNRAPKSMRCQEMFPGMSYTDINENTPDLVDALDMAEMGKERGYRASVFDVPVDNRIAYVVTITKNPGLLNFMSEKCAHSLMC